MNTKQSGVSAELMAPQALTKKSPHLTNYMLLLINGAAWGSQFVFNDMALKTVPAMTIATGRTIISAITLYILAMIFSKPAAPSKTSVKTRMMIVKRYIIICIFDAVIPFFLMPWGQQHVDSSMAAIMMGTPPLFVLLLSGIFLPGKHWSFSSISSVIIGFVGVIVLVAPSIHSGSSLIGEIAIIGASMSFAIAIILLKTLPADDHLRSIRNVLISASVIMLVLVCFIDRPWTIHFDLKVLMVLLFLGVVCSGLCYLMYMILIHRVGPTFASLSGYLVPLVGVIIGVSFGGDHFTSNKFWALAIILLALFINQAPSLFKKNFN